MNYLAHLYLSDGTSESLLGNLLADFLKAPASAIADARLREGVELHRKIDRFTDSHRIFARSVARCSAARRRAAPVLIDIFYDHFLARDWVEYAPTHLLDFLEQCRVRMLERWHLLPDRARLSMERLMPLHWMARYAEVEGIAVVVDRVALRVRTDIGLAGGVEELVNNYEGLGEDFREFFVELVSYVETQRTAKTW
ncbi:MAG: ACP phosphodiesterase [Bryobacteraceae bacterium]